MKCPLIFQKENCFEYELDVKSQMDREYTSCLRNVHIYGKTIEKDRKLDINSHMIVSVINKGKLRKFREEIPSQKNLKKKQPRLNSSIRNKCAVSI